MTTNNAKVRVTNHTSQTINFTFSHKASGGKTELFPTIYGLAPGAQSDAFAITYNTRVTTGGVTQSDDQWWFNVVLENGAWDIANSALYSFTDGTADAPTAVAQLSAQDNGQTIAINVNSINQVTLVAHNKSTKMSLTQRQGPIQNEIEHVFLLMLENRSFDHMLGFSELPGIAEPALFNAYQGVNYPMTSGAPNQMPFDPGHEFPDVLEQLCGASTQYSGGPYPTHINNSGYVSNYATTKSPDQGGATSNFGAIMKGYTATQLPVLNSLCKNFTTCTKWFSSLPGPTWPNRFFSLAASSGNMDTSPSKRQMGVWDSVDGFEFQNGTLFDTLKNTRGAGSWRIYSDDSMPPIACALHNVGTLDYSHFKDFKADINKPFYQPAFTLIEPNYGASSSGTYYGGNSQHPMDSVSSGEQFIKDVYETIRNSPLWNKSMLIVTYDEHGGFPDSAIPPAAIPPGDTPENSYVNDYGFTFDRYGVRVPAVIISPFTTKGGVDPTVYDHSSISKFMSVSFSTATLTKRDAASATIPQAWGSVRTDCPTQLPNVYAFPATPAPQVTPSAALMAEPMIDSGNSFGFLYILRKAELELSPPEQRAAILADFDQLKTKGDVEAYRKKVLDMIAKARAARGM